MSKTSRMLTGLLASALALGRASLAVGGPGDAYVTTREKLEGGGS